MMMTVMLDGPGLIAAEARGEIFLLFRAFTLAMRPTQCVLRVK
jgi:hypothetical protein